MTHRAQGKAPSRGSVGLCPARAGRPSGRGAETKAGAVSSCGVGNSLGCLGRVVRVAAGEVVCCVVRSRTGGGRCHWSQAELLAASWTRHPSSG